MTVSYTHLDVYKRQIIKLLAGEKIRYSGTFRRGSGLIISYLPQDTSFLQGSLDAFIAQYHLDLSLLHIL